MLSYLQLLRQRGVVVKHASQKDSQPKGGKVYIGFNLADSMFDGEKSLILRRQLTFQEVQEYRRRGVISVVNVSHRNTIQEIERRYHISLPFPDAPPRVQLEAGDAIIVISSRGLPRKTGNVFEYTPEELQQATFSFSIYILLENEQRPAVPASR